MPRMQAGDSLRGVVARTPEGLRSAGNPVPTFAVKRTLLFASAAVCVVHDLSNSQQSFFARHTDNVSCLCVSRDGRLAASGQVGRRPEVFVWRTDTDRAVCGDLPQDSFVTALGAGFFERAVCAIEFSFDDKLLVGVGSDDRHRLGIWQLSTGLLLAESVCQNGLPPQINWIAWSPAQQFAGYVSKESSGTCDIICTVGENHIKFWALQRPSVSPVAKVNTATPGNLFSKPGRIPKELSDTPVDPDLSQFNQSCRSLTRNCNPRLLRHTLHATSFLQLLAALSGPLLSTS